MFLRDENFDSAKILAVAHDDDLAAHIDFQLVELLEVFWSAVVGVDHIGLDVAGGRHAVEGHDDARIVLKGIVFHMLARGPVHFDACGSGQVYADFRRIVDPNLVFDDLGVESGVAKFLRHVIGGGFIFGRACHVRGLGEDAQMFFREFGIGGGDEARFQGGFGSGIAKAEDGLRCRRGGTVTAWVGRRSGDQECGRQNGGGKKSHRAPAVKVSKVAQEYVVVSHSANTQLEYSLFILYVNQVHQVHQLVLY